MKQAKKINEIRERRRRRIRSKIKGTSDRPRFSVFRSNNHTYAQLIDDEKMQTVVSASTKELPKEKQKLPKIEQAKLLGALLADKAAKKEVKRAVFDRGSYLFHGRIKAAIVVAREKGLKI